MTEYELMKMFGDNLDILLYEWGMNQQDLARETGLNQSTISRCLKGEQMPNLKTVVNIMMALGCEFDELVTRFEHVD